MKRRWLLLTLVALLPLLASAQDVETDNGFTQMTPDGRISTATDRRAQADSLGTDKEVPKGITVWTVDRQFGDIRPAQPDTFPHRFYNTTFTDGREGEYNTLGQTGSPRISRIFTERQTEGKFIFTQPYDFFITPPEKFLFTNTLSPLTNLSYHTAGNRTNGDDRFTAKFGVNAGKRLGAGFIFDYLYARGFYANQSTSHMGFSLYGSYLGDRYQAHLLLSNNHQKVTENGGITNDQFITHPEIFTENYSEGEIPTMLQSNWNRNDNQHLFFTHRYSVGFKRRVPMTKAEIEARRFALAAKAEAEKRRKAQAAANEEDEEDVPQRRNAPSVVEGRPDDAPIATDSLTLQAKTAAPRVAVTNQATADSLIASTQKQTADTTWMKDEYVPVTSFIHTLDVNNYKRIYQAYQTPENYYLNTYDVDTPLPGDSIYDKTTHLSIKNTFAISLLEGFNKWAKAGLKVFASHELRRFTLPALQGTSSWTENAVRVGGQLSKRMGTTLHYTATGQVALAGADAGEIHLDGNADLNFKLWRDTVTLALQAFYHHERPSFYFYHYQSKHFWWNNDLSMTDRLHLEGALSYTKTGTTVRVAADELKNYAYLATNYLTEDDKRFSNEAAIRQTSSPITVLTAQLMQHFLWGPLGWETTLTYQASTNQDVVPVPALNIYSNVYLRFRIAKVLRTELGLDLRFFTRYNAPEYVPALGNFAVREGNERVETGGYPLANAYANFHLKRTRFYIMFGHVNSGMGSLRYLFTPHHPLNGRVLRFGLSWNFWN